MSISPPLRPISSGYGKIKRLLYHADLNDHPDYHVNQVIHDLVSSFGSGVVCVFPFEVADQTGYDQLIAEADLILSDKNRINRSGKLGIGDASITIRTDEEFRRVATQVFSKEFGLRPNNIIIEIRRNGDDNIPMIRQTIRDPFMVVTDGANSEHILVSAFDNSRGSVEKGAYSRWLRAHEGPIGLPAQKCALEFEGGNQLYSNGVLFLGRDSALRFIDDASDNGKASIATAFGFAGCQVVLVGLLEKLATFEVHGIVDPSGNTNGALHCHQPFFHIDMFLMLGKLTDGVFEYLLGWPDIRYQTIEEPGLTMVAAFILSIQKRLQAVSKDIDRQLIDLGFTPRPIRFPLPLHVTIHENTHLVSHGVVPYINGLMEIHDHCATITTGRFHDPSLYRFIGINFAEVLRDLGTVTSEHGYQFNFIASNLEGFAGLHCHTLELERG